MYIENIYVMKDLSCQEFIARNVSNATKISDNTFQERQPHDNRWCITRQQLNIEFDATQRHAVLKSLFNRNFWLHLSSEARNTYSGN